MQATPAPPQPAEQPPRTLPAPDALAQAQPQLKQTTKADAPAVHNTTPHAPADDLLAVKSAHSSLGHASWLSQWTFWWMNSLLTLGYRRPLQNEDLPELPDPEQARRNADDFERILHDLYHPHQPTTRHANKQQQEQAKQQTTNGTATNGTTPQPSAASSKPPSMLWALWRLVGVQFSLAIFYAFISETMAFASPVLVEQITSFLDDASAPEWRGWLFVALIFVLPSIGSIAKNQYYIAAWRVAIRVRAAMVGAVFRKALKLSPAARRIVSDGEVLTLISADAQKIADLWASIFVLFTAPFSIFACFVLIWLQLGPSTLAGAGVIAVLMPTNIWLGRRSGGLRRLEAAQTDLRMRFVKESVSNMRVIKQYGWSASFQERITDVRRKEIAVRKKAAYLEALSNCILILTPVLISLVTFLTFAGAGNELTATNVFTSISLFNVLRFQLSQFPLVLTAVFECRVSLHRLQRLILREELDPSQRDYSPSLPPPGQSVARIDGATFSWDQPEEGSVTTATQQQPSKDKSDKKDGSPRASPTGNDSNFRLSDINLTVQRGSFVGIVGAVGSGKSSLLSALLGEVKRISGPPVLLRGRVAIVPQSAWILNLTLRDNVLYGLPFDEATYQRTIDLCCLRPDLAQLPAGDQTEIGDKGVNLSGGQKQRTAIARAVYAVLMGQADTILCDDALSAVDSHVSKALFDNVLSKSGVIGQSGATLILALNQLHYLPRTDWVVVMKGGRIDQQGTYSQLMQQGGELASLMSNYGFKHDDEEDEEDDDQEGQVNAGKEVAAAAEGEQQQQAPVGDEPVLDASKLPASAAVVSSNSETGSTGPAVPAQTVAATLPSSTVESLQSPTTDSVAVPAAIKDTQTNNKLSTDAAATTTKDASAGRTTKAETRVEGKVDSAVYKAYARASGGLWVPISLILLFCVHQTGRVYQDFWLADWAEQDWDQPKHSLAFWMGILSVFGSAVTIASLLRSGIFARQGLKASYSMHQNMQHSVFAAPSAFFDVTPIGRVVNRFSSDTDKLDHMLIRILEGYGGCVFFVLGTFVAICVVFPYFAIVLVVVIAIYWRMQLYYVTSSRELQRLDNISKSPIFSHFGESLAGAASIRAFASTEACLRANEAHIDLNQRAILAFQGAICWLGVRTEFVSTLLMTVSAIFAVSLRSETDAALVGLSIVYSVTITSFLNIGVRLGSMVESLMSSVERMQEFSEIPSEAQPRLPGDPSPSWPSQGDIRFRGVVMRYRPELDVVLKGVEAHFAAGEKVGIIGRTGSGKSSLTVALFRLVELEAGSIEIDGVDIGKIGLETLRTRITLIPQDPVVFGGTVRYNLDPFGHCDDESIWRVLRLVNLETKIRGMDGALDFQLSEGESLSLGERQLLCVARAMLRSTKVLILDEATASIDIESDNRIQQVVSTQFEGVTVLAIAHRLSTIMDFDKILVMDGGNVAEFGVPHDLLQNPASHLLSLVEATGPASAAHLKAVARAAWENRKAGRPARLAREQIQRLEEQNALDSAAATGLLMSSDGGVDTSCVRFHSDDAESAL